MDTVKLIGIIAIVAGVLGLIYGGVSYTQETHAISMGALEMSVEEKGWFNVSIWAGVVGIAIGCGLLVSGHQSP